MAHQKKVKKTQPHWTRREFIWTVSAGCAAGLSAPWLWHRWKEWRLRTETFVAKVDDYGKDISEAIRYGFKELGVTPAEIKGKRILLKPNLVDTLAGEVHINTHPSVVRGAIEAFLSLGAAIVIVAEGPAHCRDSLFLLEESGIAQILMEDRIRFVDINYDDIFTVGNKGNRSRLTTLILPEVLKKVDWIVSMAKMKTHHWAGVTLSMKNLFGVMPGSYYGWPKNVLHCAGINNAILDINASVKPHFAIVDGIVGMEGDGPIMGAPKSAGVLVMGRNFPAVDATCARIMGVNPYKVPHLAASNGWLGTIRNTFIRQRGETIASVQTNFNLIEKIPAQKGIRL